MNMGEAVIRVTAELGTFQQQQQQIVSDSVSTGEKAARGFADKFGDYIERAKGQISQKLQKAIEPDAIIRGLTTAIETFNAGEGVVASLEAAASSVPLFGSAYKLGKAIGGTIREAVTGEAEIARALQAETAEMVRFVERRNKEEERKTTERRQKAQGISSATAEGQRLSYDMAIQQAKLEGNLREAAFQETLRTEFELRRQLEQDLRDAKSDEEKALLQENYDTRIRLEQRALEERYRKIASDEAKQAETRAKQEADAAEQARKEAEDLAKQQQRDAERLADEQKRAREQEAKILEDVNDILDEGAKRRIATQQETGVAQTAGGAFTFNAYTDQEKKANDDKIVRGIGELVIAARSGSGGFS